MRTSGIRCTVIAAKFVCDLNPPCWREQAKHDRDATHDLRPEHLVEIGQARLDGTHSQSKGKQRAPMRLSNAAAKGAVTS